MEQKAKEVQIKW